jgi:hypothetical protein
MSPIGGVEHTVVDEKTYNVHARGNGFTSKDDIRDYIILRSADIAAARNCDAFEVVTARNITTRYHRKSDGRLAHEFPEMEATVRLIATATRPAPDACSGPRPSRIRSVAS